ncbi:MAG: ABC transporter substrate-binding protein [Deltaproteobacteria bacterium]|nr:ABC transporter substrate-binding protein [Deltaproteobacteria bacterium]MBI3075666.1 ABC transporter substrate-binding protein [Deltaproteobacteria bacterium]
MAFRALLSGLVATWLLAAPPGPGPGAARAATAARDHLTVVWASISGTMAALWVGKEAGLFERYGLQVSPVYLEGGTLVAQALTSGDVQLAQVGGPAVIRAILGGAHLVIIAAVVHTMTFDLVVQAEITRPGELRDKQIGVTRFGGATDLAARFALTHFGLRPDKDVAVIQIGGMPTMLAAMQARRVDGAMLSMPTSARAKKAGFRVLVELADLKLPYLHTTVTVHRGFLTSRRPVAVRFMRAYLDSIRRLKTDRELSLRVIGRYTRLTEPDVLEETYRVTVEKYLEEIPWPIPAGVGTILKELGRGDARAPGMDPQQFVDATVVREASGREPPWGR